MDLKSGEIEHLAFGGNGVLRSNGLVLFVPFSAPQDQLEVQVKKQKKNFAIAEIVTILKQGPSRIKPNCPYFSKCGGCQLQHLNYEEQLKAKQRFVEEAIQRQAKIPTHVKKIIPSPHQWGYRKHIRLNLQLVKDGFEAGYIGNGFIPIKECLLFEDKTSNFFTKLKELLLQLSNKGIQEGSLRIFKIPNGYLLSFSFFPYLPLNRTEVFNRFPFPVIMQSPRQKEEFGTVKCYFKMLNLELFYSPFSFLQNNLAQSENLYKTILSLTSETDILDLYCGIGITSLLFAEKGAKVIGIESNKTAIDLARKNAKNNHLLNIQFIAGEIENLALPYASCILVNPPRTGLSKIVLQKIIDLNPKEIIYISCMPSTLARDLVGFTSAGYTLSFAQPFDMFPQTTHVETIVKLERS